MVLILFDVGQRLRVELKGFLVRFGELGIKLFYAFCSPKLNPFRYDPKGFRCLPVISGRDKFPYNLSDEIERRLVSPVGKAPVCSAGGSGSIPGRTFTRGLKIIEEKVLPLLKHLQMVRPSRLLG